MLMDVTDWPLQTMVDKFCRNHAWQVMKAHFDRDNKCICAQVMINAEKSEWRTASYEDICKEFSWKSFDLTPDFQIVLPVPDPEAFYNAPVSRVKYDADGNPIRTRKQRARKSKKNSDAK